MSNAQLSHEPVSQKPELYDWEAELPNTNNAEVMGGVAIGDALRHPEAELTPYVYKPEDDFITLGAITEDGMFKPGEAGGTYLQWAGQGFIEVPLGESFRHLATEWSDKRGRNLTNSNNGVTLLVNSDGTLKMGASRVVSRADLSGYELDGGLSVPFSNGELLSAPGANAKVRHAELVSHAIALGVEVGNPDVPILEGATEYSPSLPTLEEETKTDCILLRMHENRLMRIEALVESANKEEIEALIEEMTKSEEIDEGIVEKYSGQQDAIEAVLSAQRQLVEKMKKVVETNRLLVEIGYEGSGTCEREVQRMYDLGKYSVDDESGTIRFVDAHGRYVEAPLGDEETTIEVLESKGYTLKSKAVSDYGDTILSGDEVIPPRINGVFKSGNSSTASGILATRLQDFLPRRRGALRSF